MDPSDLDRKDVRRPMNAFLIFCKRHRSIVREKNPNLDNRSVTRILGDLWANLGDDEKSQYTDLAKQYKDAFMKANPDYKWHNPERVAPPASNKPNTRPTNVRVLKSENDMNIEGQITPGKLADPSNMGGLSLLLDSSRYSSSSSTISYKVSDKQIFEADSTSSNTETETPLFTSILDNVKSDLTTDDTEMKTPLITKDKEEFDETEQMDSTTSTEIKEDKEKDENGNKFKENETGSHGNHDNMADEGPLSLVQNKGDNNDMHAVGQDTEEENTRNIVNSSGSGVTDRDPIIGCGQRVMDHIIERLFTLEKHQSDTCTAKDVKKEETTTESSSVCLDEVDGTRKITEKSTGMSDKIEKSENSIQVSNENMTVKLPFTPGKSFERNESSETQKRKRCYSESNVDTYESMRPIIKKEKLSDEEEFHQSQNSEIDGCFQSDECLEQVESASQDMEKTTDQDSADDDSHPIRKSKRRNRGQRYQELINEGIIQPSRERLASMKGDNIVKEESTTEDSAICNKYDELAHDVLSVYPRQIRKRTVSESEKLKPSADDLKRYKTGDFDLEAHIATLPACSLEKVARNAKRSIIKVRSHSDSSKKSDSDKSDVILALPVPPHLKLKNSNDTGPPPTGSQKRKARKHSVTRLIPVSSTAGISLVAVKTDNQDEEAIHPENSDEKDTIAKSLLNCEKTSNDNRLKEENYCCHDNSNNMEKEENVDSSEGIVRNDHKQTNVSSDNELSYSNSDGRNVMVTDNSKSGGQQQDVEINNVKGSKDCDTYTHSVCDEKGDHIENLKSSVLEKSESGIELKSSECLDEKDSLVNCTHGGNDFMENKDVDDPSISSRLDSSLDDKSKIVKQVASVCENEMKKSVNIHLNKPSEIVTHSGDLDTSVGGNEKSPSQQRDSVLDKNQISSPSQTSCDKEEDTTVSVSCDSVDLSFSTSISTSISHVQTSTSDQAMMSHTTSVQPGMSIAVQSS